MSSTSNITTITPPRVPLVDPRTGLISREWYRFFLNLFTLTYENTGGGNTDYLSFAPLPVDYTGVIDAGLQSLEIAPPPIDYTAEIEAVKNTAAFGTAPPIFFGTLAYQNSENAFVTRLNTVSATTGVRNGSIYEDSDFLVATGTNGVVTGIGTTSVTVTQTTGFRPFLSNTYNLGTASQRWASVYANEFLAGAAQQAKYKEDSGFAFVDGTNGVVTAFNTTPVTVTQATGFRPYASNTYSLGTGSQRWTSVYANEFLAGAAQQARYQENSGFAFVDGDSGVITAYNGSLATVTQSAGFRPWVDSAYNLGTSSYFWLAAYADTFYAKDTTTKFYEDSGYAVVVGSSGVVTGYGTTAVTVTQTTGFRPQTDNTYDLGTSGQRWKVVYAATGTINTSDATEKQQVRDLSDAELRVARRVKSLIRAFKWNSAVDAKGDAARTHIGVMAQDVRDAFAQEGLDAHQYGLFCSDDLQHDDGSVTTRLGVRYDELLAFVIAAM